MPMLTSEWSFGDVDPIARHVAGRRVRAATRRRASGTDAVRHLEPRHRAAGH